MLKDRLWVKICDSESDAICDKCIEKRMGRPILESDFKTTYGNPIPCNQWWLQLNPQASLRSL